MMCLNARYLGNNRPPGVWSTKMLHLGQHYSALDLHLMLKLIPGNYTQVSSAHIHSFCFWYDTMEEMLLSQTFVDTWPTKPNVHVEYPFPYLKALCGYNLHASGFRMKWNLPIEPQDD